MLSAQQKVVMFLRSFGEESLGGNTTTLKENRAARSVKHYVLRSVNAHLDCIYVYCQLLAVVNDDGMLIEHELCPNCRRFALNNRGPEASDKISSVTRTPR